MLIVIDASIVLKWFLTDENDTSQALDIYKKSSEGEIFLLGPRLLPYEVLNGFFAASLRNRFTKEYLLTAAQEIPSLNIQYRPARHEKVLELALQARLSLYDSAYLDVADREGAALITADRHLYLKASKILRKAIWLQDWPLAI